MSNSEKARIIRKSHPKQKIRPSPYRSSVLQNLKEDFENRCAYSMQHETRAGGLLDIDHFDPRQKRDSIQDYNNLFLATRFCNGKKGKRWPTKAEKDAGCRFLNPCEEIDYGEHIFEDPNSHELVGVSLAAKWHIRMLGLNAPHFVRERAERARNLALIRSVPINIKVSIDHADTTLGWDHQKNLDFTVAHLMALLKKIHPDVLVVMDYTDWLEAGHAVMDGLPEPHVALEYAGAHSVTLLGTRARYDRTIQSAREALELTHNYSSYLSYSEAAARDYRPILDKTAALVSRQYSYNAVPQDLGTLMKDTFPRWKSDWSPRMRERVIARSQETAQRITGLLVERNSKKR